MAGSSSHTYYLQMTAYYFVTTIECRNLLDILESYEKASGQAINRKKKPLSSSTRTQGLR